MAGRARVRAAVPVPDPVDQPVDAAVVRAMRVDGIGMEHGADAVVVEAIDRAAPLRHHMLDLQAIRDAFGGKVVLQAHGVIR